MEVARKESLANPTLIFEMGMPDLKVINDHVNDETTTVFCRNSELPPIVSVIDIDHTPSPEEAVLERQRVIDLLKSGGYQRIPHLIE